jgi:hypothetical protein
MPRGNGLICNRCVFVLPEWRGSLICFRIVAHDRFAFACYLSIVIHCSKDFGVYVFRLSRKCFCPILNIIKLASNICGRGFQVVGRTLSDIVEELMILSCNVPASRMDLSHVNNTLPRHKICPYFPKLSSITPVLREADRSYQL